MRTVVSKYIAGDASLDQTVRDYVEASQDMQHRETPSGGYRTGGLGEVKYEVDREPFVGEWGRPQNDGPASRVITLVQLANHWLEGTEEQEKFVKQVLYDSADLTESVIKADLDHIAEHYAKPGFDREHTFADSAATPREMLTSLRMARQCGRRFRARTSTRCCLSRLDSPTALTGPSG